MAPGVLMLALMVVVMNLFYFLSPPKRQPFLDPKRDASTPVEKIRARSFALKIFALLAPPTALICWFLTVIWAHRTLTAHEQIAVLIAMPVVVGLVSWIIYLRVTRHHVGERNKATQFVALSMMATWIGSTFLFFALLACCLAKSGSH